MMKEPIARSSQSERDLADIIESLVQREAIEAASRFLIALERTIEDIAEFPDIGAPLPLVRHSNWIVRCRPVRRFRSYLVVFRRTETGVLIMRIVHGHRNIDDLVS